MLQTLPKSRDNANLQFKYNDREKTEDTEAIKNEIRASFKIIITIKLTTVDIKLFSTLITSNTSCGTSLMSFVNDLNHE